MAVLVTGAAGFVGSNFVHHWFKQSAEPLINLDALTYAGNADNLAGLPASAAHRLIRGSINDRALVGRLLAEHKPRAVIHFAAESHVDRSIRGPQAFVETNVNGTFTLLDEARLYWQSLEGDAKNRFRFLHVSTDEVYGSLGPSDPAFSETTQYAPNSPYAASKAASDHFVRAYHHTYGMPTLITNCSNNYGPFQFPEKLIPLMILNAKAGKALPVYGDGRNVRDWLYVTDHCEALRVVLERGKLGKVYNVGGNSERTNMDVVETLCKLMDERLPGSEHRPHRGLVQFVTDRPGHDRRYAIDATKIRTELGWSPAYQFETALAATVDWYLAHDAWVQKILSGDYRRWVDEQYGTGAGS